MEPIQMSIDNVFEIAYQADYITTKTLLKTYKKLNVPDFWITKYFIMYPHIGYLNFFTTEENILIQERKDFVFMFEDQDDMNFSPIITEYNDSIKGFIKSAKYLSTFINYIPISNINAQFVIIKAGEDGIHFVFDQCRSDYECKKLVIDDAKNDTYDSDYYILDMASFVPYFNGIGLLRKPKDKVSYKFISGATYQ